MLFLLGWVSVSFGMEIRIENRVRYDIDVVSSYKFVLELWVNFMVSGIFMSFYLNLC